MLRAPSMPQSSGIRRPNSGQRFASSSGIPRVYHSTALLLPDARVLSMGGNGFRETEIYSPPYLFKGTRPTITSAPASVAYGQSFFVGTPDAAAISKVTMLRLSSVTHAFNMSQHISTLSFSQATGGLNVVAPAGAAVASQPPLQPRTLPALHPQRKEHRRLEASSKSAATQRRKR